MFNYYDFKDSRFLVEGGNVGFSDERAIEFDMKKLNRVELIKKIKTFLIILNKFYYDFSEKVDYLWSEELIINNKLFSGSTKHLFDIDKIPDDTFIELKPTVGDIDIKIDGNKKEQFKKFMDSLKGSTFGRIKSKLIDYKESGNQVISLWKLDLGDDGVQNVQIDFELVDFKNGTPTEYSTFVHSSSLEDLKQNIKGVFHKFLIRALLRSNKVRFIEVMKTKEKIVNEYIYSFSPMGLRTRYVPVDKDSITVKRRIDNSDNLAYYKKMATSESNYDTDVDNLFFTIFSKKPSTAEKEQFSSYLGILKMMKRFFVGEDKEKITKTVTEFTDILFGDNAQLLYRDDEKRDKKEKLIALNKMTELFNLDIDTYLKPFGIKQ